VTGILNRSNLFSNKSICFITDAFGGIHLNIKVVKSVLSANDELAGQNRDYFRRRRIRVINIMASPGAGKTSVLIRLISLFKGKYPVFVIEGDTASSIDTEKITASGIPAIQINTGDGCHLDAAMIRTAAEKLLAENNYTVENDSTVNNDSFLFIENVGNLICPAAFDLGEILKLLVASVPEGHDKPYKYLSMFEAADIIVLNKIDLLPFVDFDRALFYRGVEALNSRAKIFEVSCRTGQGIEALAGGIINLSDLSPYPLPRNFPIIDI
jgi:hydrogenase nickel incorporation protein HypB